MLVFGQGAEVALDMDAVPEFRRLAEEGSKADGHGGCDGTAGVDDLVNGTGRDTDGAGGEVTLGRMEKSGGVGECLLSRQFDLGVAGDVIELSGDLGRGEKESVYQ